MRVNKADIPGPGRAGVHEYVFFENRCRNVQFVERYPGSGTFFLTGKGCAA